MTEQEYGTTPCTTPMERIAIWQEHCRRVQRSEDRVWSIVLTVLGLVAFYFFGFASAAWVLVK